MRDVKKKGWLAFFDYFNRFLSNRCVFDSFCFKQYLVSDFIANKSDLINANFALEYLYRDKQKFANKRFCIYTESDLALN